jgi:hypothetical protein
MEARSVKPTEAELLDALREAFTAKDEDGPDDAFTTGDLCERTDRNPTKVQRALRDMIRRGEAECVYVYRIAIDGRRARVPAYRLKGPLAA